MAKGQTEIGAGFGVSSGKYGSGSVQGYAGALGLKHGLTDEDAVIVKGWMSDSANYAVGAGVTHRF